MLILESISHELLLAICMCLFLMIIVVLFLYNKLQKQVIDMQIDINEWIKHKKHNEDEN